MPMITVQMSQGHSLEAKRKFVADVTKSACENFNVPQELIWITFDESTPENFAMGGKLYVDKT